MMFALRKRNGVSRTAARRWTLTPRKRHGVSRTAAWSYGCPSCWLRCQSDVVASGSGGPAFAHASAASTA